MELYQLQTFVIVAEEHSITSAARRLYTTPSSVSMHIKALEDELNVQLFIRTSRGMQITPLGQRLYEKARQTLHAAQNMVNVAAASQDLLIGLIALGINAAPDFLRIPVLITSLRTCCPGIQIKMKSLTTSAIIANVRANYLDVGFIFGVCSDPALINHPLGTADLVITVPQAWAAQLADGQWDTIAQLPWINTGEDCPFQPLIDDLFVGHGTSSHHADRHIVYADDEDTRGALVAAGVGVSLLEKSEAEQLVSAGKAVIWAAPPVHCDLSIVYPAYRQHDPLLVTVVKQILAQWHSPPM